MEVNKIIQGDSLEVLKTLPSESVDCVITSPPYWGLRDYGTAEWEGGDEECEHIESENKHAGQRADRNQDGYKKAYKETCQLCGAKRIDAQLGLEKTPEEYVAKIVEVFREVKRVLKKEGTLWLNIGDSYSGSGKGPAGNLGKTHNERHLEEKTGGIVPDGLKPKDLVGIPWRVAFALQADGWYLRQDIIWAKPNPMPESVTDRCTKSHEYVFLMSKSPKYYFDNEAIKEPAIYGLHSKENRPPGIVRDRLYGYDSKEAVLRGRVVNETKNGITIRHPKGKHGGAQQSPKSIVDYRNRRSVWTIPTKPFAEAHFAVFPEALIEPMIKAGSKKGDIVLDPFMGSGTTALVARNLGRNYLGIELNAEYIKIAEKRLSQKMLL